jgi:hypothetical protein
LVVVPYCYYRIDEQVRRKIEARLAANYPGLVVRVRSAELQGQGIEIHALSIFQPDAPGPQAELLYVDEIFFACDTDWRKLLHECPEVTRIVVRRPMLRLTRREDGGYSAARLFPLPTTGGRPPAAEIENGTVEIFDPLKVPSSTLVLRDINLSVKPPASSAESGPLVLEGHFSGDHVPRAEVRGTLSPDGQSWTLSGSGEGLQISADALSALPALPQGFGGDWSRLASLRDGQAQLTFLATHNAGSGQPVLFEVDGRLSGGRIEDPRLPHPLTDVQGSFHCDNTGCTIENLTAHSGQTQLRFDCQQQGYSERSPLELSLHCENLSLDTDLWSALPAAWQAEWHKYLPAGSIDADLNMKFDGAAWTPDLVIRCRDVSFSYYLFPYRLEHAQGVLTLDGNQMKIVGLRGFSGPREVRIDGEVVNPGDDFVGEVRVGGNGLPIDERLLAALPDQCRETVRSLNPAGEFSFGLRVWKTAAPQAPVEMSLQAALSGCSIRYARFPYPINSIQGLIELNNGAWEFRELTGSNDTGTVRCQGWLRPTPQGDVLALGFSGVGLPLNTELRNALPPAMQRLWNDLQPRGFVHVPQCEIRYLLPTDTMSINARVEPAADTVSLEAQSFPYRLERFHGALTYQDGRIQLNRLSAAHDKTLATVNGVCNLQPDGSWEVRLDDITCDQLYPEPELIEALPYGLQRAMSGLRPQGMFHVRGKLDAGSDGRPGSPIWSSWDLRVDVQQASVDSSIRLDNIHGGLTLRGTSDGVQARHHGELAIDSLTYQNSQFTQVQGPFWCDGGMLLLGASAPQPAGGPPRRLRATLHGGAVTGDISVKLGADPEFHLVADVRDADLARCAQDAFVAPQKLSGQVLGLIDLTGRGSGAHTLMGHGNVHLRNADIYELPLMVRLLKLLSIRRPDTTAFTSSDIDFQVQGPHVYFTRLNFMGDAISLLGEGQMGLNGEVSLSFQAVAGHGKVRLPIVRDLWGEAARQTMSITVSGTLDNPEIKRSPLPGVGKAIEALQADRSGQRR